MNYQQGHFRLGPDQSLWSHPQFLLLHSHKPQRWSLVKCHLPHAQTAEWHWKLLRTHYSGPGTESPDILALFFPKSGCHYGSTTGGTWSLSCHGIVVVIDQASALPSSQSTPSPSPTDQTPIKLLLDILDVTPLDAYRRLKASILKTPEKTGSSWILSSETLLVESKMETAITLR